MSLDSGRLRAYAYYCVERATRGTTADWMIHWLKLAIRYCEMALDAADVERWEGEGGAC